MSEANHIDRSLAIRDAYRQQGAEDGLEEWGATDYMSGFVGDIGKLSKLVMARSGLRHMDGDIDAQLTHEIGDAFWSLYVICDELGINPHEARNVTLTELEKRLGITGQEGATDAV